MEWWILMDIKYQTATPKSICDQRLFTGSLLNEMTATPLASSSFSWKKRRKIRENSAMFGLGTAKKLRFDGFFVPKKSCLEWCFEAGKNHLTSFGGWKHVEKRWEKFLPGGVVWETLGLPSGVIIPDVHIELCTLWLFNIAMEAMAHL